MDDLFRAGLAVDKEDNNPDQQNVKEEEKQCATNGHG